MKAISLHQPWASLIALGFKRYETRTWSTAYRGPLAICAAKKWTVGQVGAILDIERDLGQEGLFTHMLWDPPLGKVVALVDLVDCVKQTPELLEKLDPTELAVGGWSPGRYAWQLASVRPLREPVPVTGRQGLFHLSEDLAAKVRGMAS